MSEARLQQFRVLVEPHLGKLYRAAYRLTRNRADAEDLVQDSCLRVWERFPELADPEHLRRWLMRVLFNRFVDDARRGRIVEMASLSQDDAAGQEIADGEPDPEARALLVERIEQLGRACAALDREQYALLVLRAEGYGLSEIEAITGIAREVVGARLYRARRSLVRHLRAAPDCDDTPALYGRGK